MGMKFGWKRLQKSNDRRLRVHAFSGGLYAVTRFTGLEKITDVWGALVR
jgi:DNA gyrase inhibitor GyrI